MYTSFSQLRRGKILVKTIDYQYISISDRSPVSSSRFELLYVKILKSVILTTQGEESGHAQTPVF